jgi:large subunit ribosomal protein L4
MVSLTVYNKTGAEVGKYELDPTLLAPKVNRQLLHDAVVMYQASARQGTHRTKNRGEVSGTGKKMYRQKGTGNARAGTKQAVQRRGGGHAFALRPRDYSYRMPRKAVQLATRMALVARLQDNEVVLIDELAFGVPKTKEMAAILKALGLAGVSTLVATAGLDPNVYKSARNIDRVCVSPVSDLNALLLLKPRKVLMTRAALDAIKEKAAAGAKKKTETAAS